MKKGKKTRRTDNIDDFLEKALAKPVPKRASKALVRSDVPKEPTMAEPTNTMIQIGPGESMFARLEERKRAKERAQELIAPPLAPRLSHKDEEPEEVYEEDFEEEPPEPPKKPARATTPLVSKKQDDSKLRISVEEINRLVAKDTEEARKREEEEAKALELKKQPKPTAQMIVQKSTSTAPKQLEPKTKSQQLKRNSELLDIIQFESYSEGIFDLQSTNEYDEMMRKLQVNEAKNSSTQWNDDYIERDVQTNEVEMGDKTTQWPEDLNVVKSTGMSGVGRFLKRVLPTIEAVLEENVGGKGRGVKLAGEQTQVKYIASRLDLSVPQDFLDLKYSGTPGHVTAVSFFPLKTSLVAVSSVYGSETVICVWDVQSNSLAKVMHAVDVVTCLCVPSNTDYVVLCGTAAGAILLWDLRENGHNHPVVSTGAQTYYLREPTYSTEGLSDSGHTGAIDRLMELLQTDVRNFQVASLDTSGNLLSWSVIELPNADEAGSELDLGLRIGGRMKLVPGTSTTITSNLKQQDSECSSLAFDPGNNQ